MKRERDTQRKRFYAAWRSVARLGKPLDTMKEVNQYLARMDRATLVRRYGDAVVLRIWPLDVRDGRGYGRAAANPAEGWITLPRGNRDTMTVLRLAAYSVLYRQSGRGDRRLGYRDGSRRGEIFSMGAWHGWQYCSVVLDLVRYVEGKASADALEEAFKREGVRYSKPIVRKMSSAQKARAQQRGVELAAQNRDRKLRGEFAASNPEAEFASPDLFVGDWEDLYRLWRP